MGKIIYRTDKVNTSGEVCGREREANRTRDDIGKFPNSDIDWELTEQNHSFKTTHNWVDAVKAKCKELGCPVKKDSVLVLDHLITASPEWMWEQTEETRMQFFEDAKQWVIDEFCGGDENLLLNCVVHKDEPSNWHMTAATIPIMRNKQRSEEELSKLKRKPRQGEWSLNAKEIMGGRAKYGSRQQSIEDKIGKKYGLEEREIREQGQAKKHKTVQQAKLDAIKEQVRNEEQQRQKLAKQNLDLLVENQELRADNAAEEERSIELFKQAQMAEFQAKESKEKAAAEERKANAAKAKADQEENRIIQAEEYRQTVYGREKNVKCKVFEEIPEVPEKRGLGGKLKAPAVPRKYVVNADQFDYLQKIAQYNVHRDYGSRFFEDFKRELQTNDVQTLKEQIRQLSMEINDLKKDLRKSNRELNDRDYYLQQTGQTQDYERFGRSHERYRGRE